MALPIHHLQNLDVKLQALVCVACLGEEGEAFELFRFVPTGLEKQLIQATKELLGIPKNERSQVIARELKRMMASQKHRQLGEIHTGWFVDLLKEENPQTIRLVLGYLPSDQTQYVLEHLPEKLRKKIPLGSPANLSEPLVQLIRRRFYSQFPQKLVPHSTDSITLRDLYFIKTSQLLNFFQTLGVELFAKAFHGIENSVLQVFLNRLPIPLAKEVQSTIKSLQEVPKKEREQAQSLILDLPLENMRPEAIGIEIGIAFFARAAASEEEEFVQALTFKLPPEMGYLLRRYINENNYLKNTPLKEWIHKQVLEKFQHFPI